MSSSDIIREEIDKAVQREKRIRRRALLYTLLPIVVATVLVVWTGWYLRVAREKVLTAEDSVKKLKKEADRIHTEMDEAGNRLTDIITVTRRLELFIESQETKDRPKEVVKLLIGVRMMLDELDKKLLNLSSSFPAVGSLRENRRWITIVKSTKDLESLRLFSHSWVAEYGVSNMAIYKAPNGFYALAILEDGSFTAAYRLTVSLKQTGRATGAYFAREEDWGQNFLR
ncbi:MAG: hypothetical protein LAO31_19170 [Acidobacteriia bacterium]|nr:hypothetical protein [Terriglobia bacterium]